MRLDLDNLPSDMVLLHGLLRDMAAVVEHCDGEIERLQTIIKQLQRTQFGRRSERLDPDQLALALEDLDSDIGRAEASGPQGEVEIADKRPRPSATAIALAVNAR
jgi:transposase